MKEKISSTLEKAYVERLIELPKKGWKRWVNTQVPYRWNLQRLKPGFTLDIGCGIGRHLKNLDGNGVGIDHNSAAVQVARSFGYEAFIPQDFLQSKFNLPNQFDSILVSHVLEHMKKQEALELLAPYLPLLKPSGKLILITPQEKGYQSDSTHIEFMDFTVLSQLVQELGFSEKKQYSYPFPRWAGRFFIHNEFVSLSQR